MAVLFGDLAGLFTLATVHYSWTRWSCFILDVSEMFTRVAVVHVDVDVVVVLVALDN